MAAWYEAGKPTRLYRFLYDLRRGLYWRTAWKMSRYKSRRKS